MQTFADPLLPSKMPLFDGTVASVELSKPPSMPGFLGKQKLQYNYFTYEPRMKDGAEFTPPWRNPKSSPVDDRSPVSHLSGMELPNHMICKKDSISAEESFTYSPPVCHTLVKKGFMPYTKSPEISSPSAASPVLRKPIAGGESSSSPSQNPVYIAIPKPVYGLNPCCNELGCVMGHRYSMEHLSPRVSNAVYEHSWLQTNGHYVEKPPSQRKEALLQQKDLHFECSAEQLKRMTEDVYSPNRARTLPSGMEPSYSSYPCAPTRTLFSQPLQTPPGGYPGLYAYHPAYEHKTSEVYQECSPVSKYGQLAQHPAFYYSQANGEVENRTQRKDGGSKQREGAPLFHKHTLLNPQEHYVVPRTHHTEMPLSCNVEMLPSHALIQGFEYPYYAFPGYHNQIRAPYKRQHSLPAFHPSHINVSPTRQHADQPIAKEKPCAGLHVNQLHGPSFLRVEQSGQTRRVNPADISPSSMQAGRFFQPFTGLHMDAPVVPPAGVNHERVSDHSCCDARVKPPKGFPVSPPAWLHQSPSHSSHGVHAAVHHNANVRKIIYSPAATTGSKHNELVSAAGTTDYRKGLKRSAPHSSPPIKIKEEDKDLYEVECTSRRQKVEKEDVKTDNHTDSPPMPVINNVFSLAPYHSQLLVPRGHERFTPTSEQRESSHEEPKVKERKPGLSDQQPVLHKEVSSSPADTSDAGVFGAKRVKVENVSSDSDECKEDQNTQSDVTIKEEPKDAGSADTMLKEICESDETDSKFLHAGENSPAELKPADVTTQTRTHPSSHDDMLHKQTLQPPSVPSLHPAGSKVSFRSIPPHCLKLSTYKMILPEGKHCKILPHPEEKTSPQSVAVFTTPVRKHFLELHQSLCDLISKSVSASPEEELKSWLSQLEVTEPAHLSDKVQKVSCLLGAQAREAWINEEIESALREVLGRLQEYTAQRRCPFPHVMRTGAVFLPMLVVKELLFPTVQGSFIDKVLQEHKVELRPTTLSEEKILIQLHKRACSSRLRRLMSLKHLPDIYTETINLLHYTCVCQHLGE